MKFSTLALLILPAALAAPAPSANSFQSQACTCLNAAGVTRVDGTCQYVNGDYSGTDVEEWCYRATAWAPEMDTVFNDFRCAEMWGAEWATGRCRPITLCPKEPPYADYYAPC